VRFGVLYEHQLPRPWDGEAELRVVQEALDQVVLADRLGIDTAWAVEHHFLEEYAHCSAPEVFLAACAARTERIRLGHGIVLMPPPYNPPVRVAERLAMLDLVSRGRVEWGVGESSSRIELEGFEIEASERRAMSMEAVEQVADMLALSPYPGWKGQHVSLPPRNVVPKSVQKPHPPLWLACSNRNTIRLAARLGVGALTFAFIDADEARQWVDDYHETLARECVPIGHAVNAQVAMLTGLSCHADGDEARRRGLDGFRFFQFALAHYYAHGQHRPGRTDLWQQFEAVKSELGMEVLGGGTGCIGTPAEVTRTLEGLERAGVDETILIQQTGRARHRDICESLELLAREVLPPFRQRERAGAAARAAARAPHAEAALARKVRRPPPADDANPEVPAYGLLPVDPATLPEANRRRLEVYRRMREIIDRTPGPRSG
jgi:alkanesulfonate monooxygenase SsuD/methylene tetrahydromethanopterin reductase-like flavin-dependent oxidoreductase (luciferase family)